MSKMRRMTTLAVAAILAIAGEGSSRAQGHRDTVVQPLVTPRPPVDVATQERLGLLTLAANNTPFCSASLLRNNWAITAAHCVEAVPATVVVPAGVLMPTSSVTLRATWPEPSGQRRTASRIVQLRPHDIALIEVADAFTVGGSVVAFDQKIWDGPYGNLPVEMYGRGIFALAVPVGPAALPSLSDGKYRVGDAVIGNGLDGNLYWLRGRDGQTVGGGDSGGPSYVRVRGQAETYTLMGVHSYCTWVCLPGKACDRWEWVSAVRECADAPVRPVWDRISQIIGPRPVQGPQPSDSVTIAPPRRRPSP